MLRAKQLVSILLGPATPKWPKSLLVDVGSILGRIRATFCGPKWGRLLLGFLPEGRLGGLRFWGAFGRPILGSPILHVHHAAQDTAQLWGAQIGTWLSVTASTFRPKMT